jgi:chemotaxis protein MotB
MAPEIETQQPPEDHEGATLIWLTSFADLLALLLCFFIMLYAMSAPRNESFRAIAVSLAARLNPDRAEVPRAAAELVRFARPRAVNLDYLSAIVGERLAQESAFAGAQMTRLSDRIVVTLPPRPVAQGGIEALSQSLSLVANRIELVAHADTRAADAWPAALGQARALAAQFRRASYATDIPLRVTTAGTPGTLQIVIRQGAV